MNQSAPSFLPGTVVADTYSRLKFTTTRLADFIRGLGYDAAVRAPGWLVRLLVKGGRLMEGRSKKLPGLQN